MAREYHHGNSPAAWTAVIIIIAGFCVGSAYTVMAQPWGVAAGGAVIALGAVVGLVMRSMGLGQPVSSTAAVGKAPTAAVPGQPTGDDREPSVAG
ncbi:HGxxPAAW family protein [Streptomyces sp. PT12]|uniref:HGxxPAAW family protein n=1 Tax=Streptomyces sp. PT12 TaxID=1510197 RepID=UPI000DE2A372|nr:HGxxPAAW family protein [Streptomyces sp. PT12]RBM19704.1 hypothetical protein DEH69_09380 [Streptomyces sp. PT12]